MIVLNRFSRNTRLEKHAPLGAPPNPGGSVPITGNTFAAGAAGIAATPASAGGLQGAFGLQYVDLILTSAQILALFTTPITLVPAPGVGYRIVPVSFVFRLIGGSVAYLNGGGGTVAIALGSAVLVAQPAVAFFLVTISPNRRTQVFPYPGDTDVAANPPTTDNAPLTFGMATANLTAGNGTAHIEVYYSIEPTV